jgi:hypothetical protein
VLLNQDGVVVLKHNVVPPAVVAGRTFGNTIQFQGYTLRSRTATLDLQLFWRSERPVGGQYHFFVHLVDRQGRTAAQDDAPPIPGATPSPLWAAGQQIRDSVSLPVPPLARGNQYHLEIGWYDWRSGRRLLLADGSDHATVPLPG